MAKSLRQANQIEIEKYGTVNNTYTDFPVETKVKIIALCQDFNFFFGETGVVIRNCEGYLGIIVKYDETRHYKDGSTETSWNFNPEDLLVLDTQQRLEAAIEDYRQKLSKRFEIMDIS